MMAKKVIMIVLFVILFSCEKETEDVEKFPFYISINDFEFKNRNTNTEDFPIIDSKFGGGTVRFANYTDTFFFDTRETNIEDFLFELPAGVYDIEIETPAASLFGQANPSFKSNDLDVEISDSTDIITLNAEATCALVVVKDEWNQLENGAYIIENRSLNGDNFVSYPLERDSINKLYYTYILPDTIPDIPDAFLWFYGDGKAYDNGGLHTEFFEIGYKYLINVLE